MFCRDGIEAVCPTPRPEVRKTALLGLPIEAARDPKGSACVPGSAAAPPRSERGIMERGDWLARRVKGSPTRAGVSFYYQQLAILLPAWRTD